MKNSIQFRMGAMLIILTTLILCGFGMHEYRTQQAREITRLNNIAFLSTEQLALNLNFPIWNYDDEQIEKVVETEMRKESISAVIVRDHAGRVLSRKTRDGQWQVTDTWKDISLENIAKRKDIVRHDDKIGTVEVHVTDHFMKKDLRGTARNIVFTVIVLDLSLLIVLIISFRIMLIRPVTHLLTIADAIAGGDFRPDIAIRRKDEIGRLANAFRNMKETIEQILNDTERLFQAIQDGRLDVRGNPDAYAGDWRDLVTGINNIIDAFISPFNMTAAYIDRIAKGEIPERITQQARGDFDRINDNLNMLTDSISETARTAEAIAAGNLEIDVRERSEQDRMMKALNQMIRKLNEIMNETNEMIRSVGQGRLDVRGNAQAYDGGWRDMITGVNDLINDLSKAVSNSAALAQEMELARKIQTSLLPEASDNIHPDLDIAAAMVPADQVGGDFYDFTFDRAGQLWLAIGDVSGHGVTPGLIMMMAQTVHTTVTTNLDCDARSVVVKINEILYKNVHDRLNETHFMTFTALKYLGDGRFQHAGAHLSMIVFREKTGTCELVRTRGVYLNFKKDISKATKNAKFSLNPGDVLVLYTDGLTEAENPNRKMLDLDGFVRIVEKHARHNPETMKDMIMTDVCQWCDDNRADDMTLMIVKRKTC